MIHEEDTLDFHNIVIRPIFNNMTTWQKSFKMWNLAILDIIENDVLFSVNILIMRFVSLHFIKMQLS